MQRGKGRGTEVGDTVQMAVARQPTLLIAHDVTTEPGDRAWLSPMVLQAKAVLGGPFEAVADVGDDHGAEVKTGREAGMPPGLARPVTSAHQQRGLLSQDDFTDDGATATDQCPAGAPRTCRCATVALRRPRRDSATAACQACPLTSPCTRNHGGRRLTRWVDEHLLEAMEQRVRRRPEGMRQRKPLVEPPVGTMNRGWDAGYGLMRGREKGRTECSVTGLAYNLRRVLTLVERPRLLVALG
jgi:hypothetical protein